MATPSYLTLLNTAGVSFSGASVVGSTLTGSTLTTNTAAIGSTLTGSTITATGNVGIGTTAPGYPLDAYGGGRIANGALIFSNTATGAHGGITTGNSACMTIESYNAGNTQKYPVSLVPYGGNVGIGTTGPTALLHLKPTGAAMRITGTLTNSSTRPALSATPAAYEIRGSGSGGDGNDDGFLRLTAGGGTNTTSMVGIDLSGYSTQSEMNNTIRFYTAGSERARIDVGGNVGIGTTAPADRMSIYTPNTTTPTTFSIYNNYSGLNSSGNDYTIAAQYLGTGSYYTSIQVRVVNGGYGDSTRLDFCTPNTFSSNVQTTRMSIMPFTGNVGIGTTAPQNILHVSGTAVNGDVSRQEMFRALRPATSGVQNGVSMAVSLGANTIGVNPYGSIDFKANGLPAAGNAFGYTPDVTIMSLIGNGNVGIGTTAPVRTLHIFGTDAADVGSLIIQSSSTGNTYSSKYWSFGHNSSDGSLYLQSSHSSTANMYVRPNNAISTGWVVYSDRRLKQDITPVDTQEMLSRIRLIKPVTFRMRCPNNHALQMGVIAQDVQEVFPDMVSESHVTVMDVENPLGISFTSFIIPLLSAFQELDKFVTTKTDDHATTLASLESTIAAQQSTINALLDRVAKLEAAST